MTPAAFAKTVARLAPSENELKAIGITGREIGVFQKLYHIPKRETPLKEFEGSDALIVLIRNWDARYLQIGPIEFLKRPRMANGLCLVGEVDSDFLAVSESGVITIRNQFETEKVEYEVALSGSRFLEAMVIMHVHLTACLLDETASGKKNASLKIARKAARAAGGDAQFPFYRMMTGF